VFHLCTQSGPGAKGQLLKEATALDCSSLIAAVATATGFTPLEGRKRAIGKRPRPPPAALESLTPLLAKWYVRCTDAFEMKDGNGVGRTFCECFSLLLTYVILFCIPSWCRATSALDASKSNGDDNGQSVALEALTEAKEEVKRLQNDEASHSSGDEQQAFLTKSEVAGLYVKTLEKMSEKGMAYLAEESARIDSLLSRGIAEAKRPLFYGEANSCPSL